MSIIFDNIKDEFYDTGEKHIEYKGDKVFFYEKNGELYYRCSYNKDGYYLSIYDKLWMQKKAVQTICHAISSGLVSFSDAMEKMCELNK